MQPMAIPSAAPAPPIDRGALSVRWLHAGGETEDFGFTHDCEHQNDAPDDILHGDDDLIEGAAMPDEGWAVSTPPSPGNNRLPASRRG
jgi:hypothetical protein